MISREVMRSTPGHIPSSCFPDDFEQRPRKSLVTFFGSGALGFREPEDATRSCGRGIEVTTTTTLFNAPRAGPVRSRVTADHGPVDPPRPSATVGKHERRPGRSDWSDPMTTANLSVGALRGQALARSADCPTPRPQLRISHHHQPSITERAAIACGAATRCAGCGYLISG